MLNIKPHQLTVGDFHALTVETEGRKTATKFKWDCSMPSVAELTVRHRRFGMVRALKPGSCTVTVSWTFKRKLMEFRMLYVVTARKKRNARSSQN